MNQSFDLSQVLEASTAALRRDLPLYLPVAGVFVLLPELAGALFGPPLPTSMADMMKTPAALIALVLVPALIAAIAQLAIARLVIAAHDQQPVTVGAAVATAVAALPRLLLALALVLAGALPLAMLATLLPTGAALLVLMVPGIYLMARLLLLVPLLAGTAALSPLAALRRSWELTAADSWRVLALALALRVAGGLVAGLGFGIGSVLGRLMTRVGAVSVGHFTTLLLPALASAAFAIVSSIIVARLLIALRDSHG
ncbi:MAG: hypothetical protein ACRCUI_14180 [Polymorphobacter sp.]